jgi:hypothetical protein
VHLVGQGWPTGQIGELPSGGGPRVCGMKLPQLRQLAQLQLALVMSRDAPLTNPRLARRLPPHKSGKARPGKPQLGVAKRAERQGHSLAHLAIRRHVVTQDGGWVETESPLPRPHHRPLCPLVPGLPFSSRSLTSSNQTACPRVGNLPTGWQAFAPLPLARAAFLSSRNRPVDGHSASALVMPSRDGLVSLAVDARLAAQCQDTWYSLATYAALR